jgi:hypothetical protein
MRQSSLRSKTESSRFYTIYDPIVETEDEVVGGPWCFSINEERAYLAFPTEHLAQDFLMRWDTEGEHAVIALNELGENYAELMEDVAYLLVLPSVRDIKSLISDLEHFPYNHFLIPRQQYLVH